MLDANNFDNIYLFCRAIDFRKGISGLCSIVQDSYNLSPFMNYLFIFCNRDRSRMKALYWDKTGFALWYKVLEKDRYHWPFHLNEQHIIVNTNDLHQLLRGLNPWQTPHHEKIFQIS